MLNNTHFSTYNSGVPYHGRERGERREKEREREKRVVRYISESIKTLFLKSEYATF
jgi:hypothetical protein